LGVRGGGERSFDCDLGGEGLDDDSLDRGELEENDDEDDGDGGIDA
jgi:hypothetical protein